MINILHIQSDTGISGGISNYIEILIRDQDNHYNNFVTVSECNPIVQNKYNSSKLIIIPKSYNIKNLFKYLILIKGIINKYDIDIIHAHALRVGFAISILRFFVKFKFIYTNHGIRFSQKDNYLIKVIFFIIEFFVLFIANKYICISNSSFLFFKKFFIFKKILFINTRLNLKPRDILKKIKSERYLITGIGSILPVKGVYDFINVAIELNKLSDNFHFEWYGGGDNIIDYINYSKKNNINIHWHGFRDNKELLDGLKSSSMLLITSKFEVMPLCILEAYANNVFVFSNNFKSSCDFIENNITGLTFNTSDHHKSALEIIKIFNNKNKFIDIVNNARLFYINNHYDSLIMSNKYNKLYEDLCLQY